MTRTAHRRLFSLRSLWLAGVALLLGAAGLLAPQVAYAAGPVTLGGSYVVDTVGVVGARQAHVLDALDELSSSTGISLFVVYVDSFSGVADREAWADETAVKNDLGKNDVLLAVATGDRLYQVSVDPDFPLSDDQLSELETTAVVPSLRANDWAGAAINTATAMGELSRGEPLSPPQVTPGEAPSPATSGSAVLAWGLGGAVLATGGVVGGVYLRKRSRTKAAQRAGEADQQQLDREVGRLLVQLDDATKGSEQELGFAQAEFGDDATADFRRALELAKDKVREAFALKQKLDDATPDSATERREWSLRIIELTTTAEKELDDQTEAFDSLRDLAKNLQPAVDAIGPQAQSVRGRLEAAAATLTKLQASYSPAAVASVADNAAEAERLLGYAESTALTAPRLAADGQQSEAAVSIRRAQAAIAQADTLLAAIDTLSAGLQSASAGLQAAVSEATSDREEARALLATPQGAELEPQFTPLLRSLETGLADATAPTAQASPLAAMQSLQAANAPLDSALAQYRERAAEDARVRDRLARALDGTVTTIASVKNYIATRSGAVSVDARTRIAEAERLLGEANGLRESDPHRALALADRAAQYAGAADAAARTDVDGYSPQYGRGSSIDGSDILGGIIGGLLAGGGHSSRGSSWGGGWGGGGSSRGGGSSSRGSSSRSGGRRGGGGRF